MIIHLDGHFVTAAEAGFAVDDGAVLFGDTLFETIKVRHGRALHIDDHLDRVTMSAALLDFPCDREAIETAIAQIVARLDWPVARLRLTLSRGRCTDLQMPPADQARTLITARAYNEPTAAERAAGAACVFAPNHRVNPLSHLPQMKRGNYADCLYAARHAQKRGAREALFHDADNHMLEGATTNLFILQGNTLVTPETGERVLAGVMRRQVLKAAKALGIKTEQRTITMQELYTADEAFLTNALIGTLPIARVENTPLKRGTLADTLLDRLNKS